MGRQYLPNNRVLALDGRNRGHLFHGDQYSKAEVGNLFWVIKRTHHREQANLFLEYVSVKINFNVTLPHVRAAHKVRMGPDGWPMVPILLNKQPVPAKTLLVALDDVVISQTRGDEQQACTEKKQTKSREETICRHAAKEDQEANASEP